MFNAGKVRKLGTLVEDRFVKVAPYFKVCFLGCVHIEILMLSNQGGITCLV